MDPKVVPQFREGSASLVLLDRLVDLSSSQTTMDLLGGSKKRLNRSQMERCRGFDGYFSPGQTSMRPWRGAPVGCEILGCRPGERRPLLVLLVSPKVRLASGACRHPGLLLRARVSESF